MHGPIPYTAIGRHGVIGDRRSAALVGEDATIDWLCLPDYDGDIVCGSLLDAGKGGSFRFGSISPEFADIDGESDWAAHVLLWKSRAGELGLTDVMVWPAADARSDHTRQAIVRRLECRQGHSTCELSFQPDLNFAPTHFAKCSDHEVRLEVKGRPLRLWCDQQLAVNESRVVSEFELSAGQKAWAVLSLGDEEPWSAERAQRLVDETRAYWTEWKKELTDSGPRDRQVRRAGLLVHLLSYAPTGSLVAAPTTSLPERVGGDWNADYRFAWVRDASLSLTALAWLGNTRDCKHYIEWLCGLSASNESPLQPLYGIRGEQVLKQEERLDLQGYRGSQPVRFGNHAWKQHQVDAFGYLAECLCVYLEKGGEWEPQFWDLLERCIEYVCRHWNKPGNSIWELSTAQHYLSGKVMSWTALDRAIRVAERLNKTHMLERWRHVRQTIWTETMQRGWNEQRGSFVQRFEGTNLDAAALLVPLMGFLPPDHPRVRTTIEQVERELAIEGFVYRFDPQRTPGMAGQWPLTQFEGAFLPCTFWLATALLQTGRRDEGEAILEAVDKLTPALGMYAEGYDVRSRQWCGNMPLLFSHVEYVRAAMQLTEP